MPSGIWPSAMIRILGRSTGARRERNHNSIYSILWMDRRVNRERESMRCRMKYGFPFFPLSLDVFMFGRIEGQPSGMDYIGERANFPPSLSPVTKFMMWKTGPNNHNNAEAAAAVGRTVWRGCCGGGRRRRRRYLQIPRSFSVWEERKKGRTEEGF